MDPICHFVPIDDNAATGAMQSILNAIIHRDIEVLIRAFDDHPVHRCWSAGCDCDKCRASVEEFSQLLHEVADEEFFWLCNQRHQVPKPFWPCLDMHNQQRL